jgi:hypothetical protein
LAGRLLAKILSYIRNMLYITFNDAPTGIYFSQVTAVCKYLEATFKVNVKLIAFISLRSFFSQRRAIRSEFAHATVVPMFPTMGTWRWNSLTLGLLLCFRSKDSAIARGPYATRLSLTMRNAGLLRKVCFDARGAYTAELHEYEVVRNKRLVRTISELEAKVLKEADFRIAVSEKLVDYWKQNFGYMLHQHVVIPCTLHPRFQEPLPAREQLLALKSNLGFGATEVLIAYAGSNAGWQSFDLVAKFLSFQLEHNPALRVVFLAHELPAGLKQNPIFKDRYICKWVNPSEVRNVLSVCDYGLIIRESSVTNRVSSPVKFAEYIASGLPVLISPEIGDYSEFVSKNWCGEVVAELDAPLQLDPVSYERKIAVHELGCRNFSKEALNAEYQKLIA